MKPLFKRLPEITHTQIFQPLKRTLLTLLFTVPQVPIQYPLLGSISSGGKALAQTTSCPAGTSPGTLEWTDTENLQGFLSQNLSVGGINTTFSFSESSPGVIDPGETRIESEIYGGLNEPNLRFNIGGNSLPGQPDTNPVPVGSSATLTITFAQPVTLASPLTFLDIDRDGARDPDTRVFQDRVTIRALNGTTPVGVTGTALGTNTRVTNQGNSVLAEGINENARPEESAGNIQVTPAGAITQIQVLYQPGTEFGAPGQDETIGLARIRICAPVPGGSLGDTVYNDTNGNSIQDTGETGISGVTVNLAGAGPDGVFGTPDDISRTTTTDANGIYSFPGLPAGSYRVSVNNPAGLTPTQTQPNAVGLGAGQTINTLDFGFTRQQGSIGDTVYNDTNGNSTQNSGETGISGVTVTLVGAGPDGQFGTTDDFSRTTTTDSNGRYSFPGLPGGNYRVTVNNPAGLTATQSQPNAIALGNGQNIDTVDFGFTQQASGVSSIGDTVFNDTNGNGIQDQGEPGIGGVTINLRDSSGNVVATTTTNSNGNYSFPNLPPGNYTVSVPNPPAGFTPTLVPSAISLQPGQNVDTADFGFTQQPRGTIGDTVFSDTNGNSTQEPGEPGIPGLTVLVRDSSGNTVATTNTDANGRYSVNVPPGSYTVAVTNPPSGFTPTLTQPNPINVSNGQNIDTVDFGFRPTSQSSIGDTVFQDLNGNGVQDSNDVGISGVRVRLFGPGPDGIINTGDDNQIAEQFTDNTPNIAIGGRGNYTFNNLPPGVYRVESDTPPGNPPNDTTALTTGRNPIIVNLAANQNFLNADFGFNMTGFSGNNPGSIGDTVFNDRNNNGVQDSGEPGIPNVPLTLTLPGPDGRLDTPGDNTTQTTTTNSNGNYGFNNLPPGSYRVTITQPFDFPQITTGSPQIDVNLQSGQTLNNVDFGLRRPPGGTIGDFVFNDRNGDRTPNPGETGIPNATVTLRNSSNQIVATTTTNNNGNYIFTGLPLGNYTVDVTRPGSGLNPTTNTTLTANLTEANPDNLNIDFGFRGGTVGQANTGLRLVKRITNVFRNGQPVNITNFNTFVDDPNDNNDNILQQAGRPPAGVSQLQTPLQSGDEVEYTLYYLAEGDQDLQNVSFCDLIPPETSYSSGEISVNRAGANSLLTNAQDSDQGAFFTPLQPLPQPNQCLSQTNTKGAVIVNLGTITPDRNFGFLRFRVQID